MARKVNIRAAGALIWRARGKRIEVLLVHRPRYDDWSFPKGKAKPGESIRACCVREMKEETGYDVVLGQPAGRVHYETPEGKWKEVQYWMARTVSDTVGFVAARGRIKAAPTSEIDRVAWVGYEEAARLLTMRSDRDLLDRLIDRADDDKLDTSTLIVVRHARAVKRSAWKEGSEELRPLTASGGKRARALVPELGAYGVSRIVTSPWKRCADTVAPYATSAGVNLDINEALTETAHACAPKNVATVLEEILGRGEVPENGKVSGRERDASVVCVHRPTLPTVIAWLGEHATRTASKRLPTADPWLKTGQMLIAHVAYRKGKEPKIVAIETLRPS